MKTESRLKTEFDISSLVIIALLQSNIQIFNHEKLEQDK